MSVLNGTTQIADLSLAEPTDNLEVQIVALDGIYQSGNLQESLYRATVHDGESYCKAVCRLDNPALPKDIAIDAAYSASGKLVLLDGRLHLELGTRVDPTDAAALTARRPEYHERIDLSLPEHRYGCLLLRTSQQGTLQALMNADQFGFAPLPVTEARYAEPQKAAAIRSLVEAAEVPRSALRILPGLYAVHLAGGPTVVHCIAAHLLPGHQMKRSEDWVWRDLATAVNKAPRSWQHLLTAMWGQLQGAAAVGIVDMNVPRAAPCAPPEQVPSTYTQPDRQETSQNATMLDQAATSTPKKLQGSPSWAPHEPPGSVAGPATPASASDAQEKTAAGPAGPRATPQLNLHTSIAAFGSPCRVPLGTVSLDSSPTDKRVPVCIVCGFSGSGKSTLLQRLVSGSASQVWPEWRAALLLEEETAAEAMAWMQQGVPVVDMAKGAEAAAASLRQLFEEHNVNYVLFESKATTIPAQVLAQLQAPPLSPLVRADACITCVDALTLKDNLKALLNSMADRSAGKGPSSPLLSIVVQQIAAANVLLLTHLDLIRPLHLPSLISSLVQMNALAPVMMTPFGQIDPRVVLHTRMQQSTPAAPAPPADHSVTAPPATGLTTFTYLRHRPFDPAKLMDLLQQYFVVVEDGDDSPRGTLKAAPANVAASPFVATLPPHMVATLRQAVDSVNAWTTHMEQQATDQGSVASALAASAAAAATCASMAAKTSAVVQELAAAQLEQTSRLKQADAQPSSSSSRGWSAVRLRSEAASAVHSAKFTKFGQLLRSKGCIWLATRPVLSGLWSHSGKAVAITAGAPWLAALPAEMWPQSEKLQRELSKDFSEDGGDRRQELHFSGMNLNVPAIAEALDACLLPESPTGPLQDPFAPWPGQQSSGPPRDSPVQSTRASSAGVGSRGQGSELGGIQANRQSRARQEDGIQITNGAPELQRLFEESTQGVGCVYWHTPYTALNDPLLTAVRQLCSKHADLVHLFLLDAHGNAKNQQFGLNSRVLKPSDSRRPGAKPVPSSGEPFPVVTLHQLPLLHVVHTLSGPDAHNMVANTVAAMLPHGTAAFAHLSTPSAPEATGPTASSPRTDAVVTQHSSTDFATGAVMPFSTAMPSSPPLRSAASLGVYNTLADSEWLPPGTRFRQTSSGQLSKPPTPPYPPKGAPSQPGSHPYPSGIPQATSPRSALTSPQTHSAGAYCVPNPPRSTLTSPAGHSGLPKIDSQSSLHRVFSGSTIASMGGGASGSRVTSPGADDETEHSGHVLRLRSGAGQLKQILARAQDNNAMVVVMWLCGGYQERGSTPERPVSGGPFRLSSASSVPSTLQEAVHKLAGELRGTVFLEADTAMHPLNKLVADKFKVTQFPTAQLYYNMALQSTLRRPAVRHLITALTQALESVQDQQQDAQSPVASSLTQDSAKAPYDAGNVGVGTAAGVSPGDRGAEGGVQRHAGATRKKRSLGPPVPASRNGTVDYNPPRGWLTRGKAGETRQFPNGLGHYYPKMPCLRCGCPWWHGEDWDACCVRCGWDCEQDGYDNDSRPLPAFVSRWQGFTKLIASGTTPPWPAE